jgi:hypothetical protein
VKILSGPATVTGDKLLCHRENREGAAKMIRQPGNLPVDEGTSLRKKGEYFLGKTKTRSFRKSSRVFNCLIQNYKFIKIFEGGMGRSPHNYEKNNY